MHFNIDILLYFVSSIDIHSMSFREARCWYVSLLKASPELRSMAFFFFTFGPSLQCIAEDDVESLFQENVSLLCLTIDSENAIDY